MRVPYLENQYLTHKAAVLQQPPKMTSVTQIPKSRNKWGPEKELYFLIYRCLLLANGSPSQDMETGRVLRAGELLTAQSRLGINRRP